MERCIKRGGLSVDKSNEETVLLLDDILQARLFIRIPYSSASLELSSTAVLKYFRFPFQEVDPSVIEKESPYLLFFERDGINVSDYLPDVKNANLDISSDDDEFETDVKKYCVIQ